MISHVQNVGEIDHCFICLRRPSLCDFREQYFTNNSKISNLPICFAS
jgi:hypothetical protein